MTYRQNTTPQKTRPPLDLLPDGYYLPDEHDIFPILLPAELQRRVLFADALRWFGFPRNWRRSQDLDVVAKYVRHKAASITRRFDLLPRRLDSLAAAVVRICTGNLSSGRTQSGFSAIQAGRGRMSGVARRRRTAKRDAEIDNAVKRGDTISAVARAWNLARSTVRNILQRGRSFWVATNQSLTSRPCQQEGDYWGKTGLLFFSPGDVAKEFDLDVGTAFDMDQEKGGCCVFQPAGK